MPKKEVEELTIAEKAAVALGEEKAARYAEEVANRPDDHELVLAEEAASAAAEEAEEAAEAKAAEEDDGA